MLISSYAGRNHATVALLDELARFAGIRVVEFNPLYVNLPHDSPCHGGFMPAKALAEADVGLLVDVDVPWIPSDMPDNPNTWWAHIDVDAEKRNFPMWTFPGNLRLPGDSHRILADLLAALKAKADSGFKARAAERVKRLAEEGKARREQAAKAAAAPGTVGQINPHFLCAALAKALKPSDIVLNEAIRNGARGGPADAAHRARHLVGLAGGGLGFSGGMALGLKLAMPERTMVQIAGDGTFYFSNPQSTLAVSRHYKLPVLTVVLDNSGWAAVKEATLARLSRRRGQGRQRVRRHPGARHGFLQGRRGRRCARRTRVRPRRRRGRHRTLPRCRARRPLGGAACEGDEALVLRRC